MCNMQEFRSYMHMETKSDMIVDRSLHGELLRVNFNISFPALSCEYATLDVSDALGAKKLNLTKTVRKAPIDESTLKKVGFALADVQRPEPKYDDHSIFDDADFDEKDFESSLNEQTWEMHMKHYDVVIVNFFAPWCSWCQQLAPTWEAVTKKIHESYPESDRRIRMAKVDCVAFESLCRKHQITAYPSIRIFIHGTDEVVVRGCVQFKCIRNCMYKLYSCMRRIQLDSISTWPTTVTEPQMHSSGLLNKLPMLMESQSMLTV